MELTMVGVQAYLKVGKAKSRRC